MVLGLSRWIISSLIFDGARGSVVSDAELLVHHEKKRKKPQVECARRDTLRTETAQAYHFIILP